LRVEKCENIKEFFDFVSLRSKNKDFFDRYYSKLRDQDYFMTQLLLKEKLFPITRVPSSFREKLSGVLRIIDRDGATQGFFFDREAFNNLLEELEYDSPAFWEEIEHSRASGIVSAKTIERRLGIAT